MSVKLLGLVVVGAVLVAGAVYAFRAPAPQAPSAIATAAPAAIATAAPAIARVTPLTVRTIDGATVAVPAAGHPTIVYFMAAWCVSCLQGAVNLAQLYSDYHAQGLQVLVIDVDPTEEPADLVRFRERAGSPGYFWAMDEGGRATRAYAVRTLDATTFVNGAGEILFHSESLPNPTTLRRAVQRALGL